MPRVRFVVVSLVLGLILIAPRTFAQDPPEISDAAETRLDSLVTLHFPEPTPLETVVEAIRQKAGKDLTIELDRPALKKAGIATDTKVRIDVADIPLKAALTQVVRQAKLIYTVKDSTATITVDAYTEPDPKILETEMARVDTTIYASGYNEARFRAIALGATEAEVHKLIGKPLRESRSKPRIDWYYGPPTLRITDDGGLFDSSGFFSTAWGYTTVQATLDGKITEILGGYFPEVPRELIGSDLSEMKQHYGEPLAVRKHLATHYLVYAASKSSGSFRTRALGIDPDGKVVEIIAGYYFD